MKNVGFLTKKYLNNSSQMKIFKNENYLIQFGEVIFGLYDEIMSHCEK